MQNLRVVTWNLWWQFGPWEQRQAAIAHHLTAAAPDILCLQETWGHQVEQLAQLLGMQWVFSGGEADVARGHDFGNAVLSRWSIASSERLELPAAGKRSYRTAITATVDSPYGKVTAVSTHLDHLFHQSAVRSAQSAAVAQWVAANRGDPEVDFPVIVAGDFNTVPEADEIRSLVGLSPPPVDGMVFTDCWAQVGEGSGITWDGASPYLPHSAWPDRRLDYVFVSWPRPKPIGNPVAAHLVGVEPVDGVIASDHYGVMVDLVAGAADA